jgi:hypothetical protein
VNSNLFGATLGGDVLSAHQRRSPLGAGKVDEILGYERYRAPRAPLPRGVGRRVDDNLPNDSPAGVVRIAAGDEKPCERLGHTDGFRI